MQVISDFDTDMSFTKGKNLAILPGADDIIKWPRKEEINHPIFDVDWDYFPAYYGEKIPAMTCVSTGSMPADFHIRRVLSRRRAAENDLVFSVMYSRAI